MNKLQITQYNVQKSKDKVMAPFLREAARQGCDILAVQEPWQNPHMKATYCPSHCGYWPAYPKQFRSRACFLISKRIQQSAWSVHYLSPDIASLTLQLAN
jgi:hypothetical protein